jgi:hypothetical protein
MKQQQRLRFHFTQQLELTMRSCTLGRLLNDKLSLSTREVGYLRFHVTHAMDVDDMRPSFTVMTFQQQR